MSTHSTPRSRQTSSSSQGGLPPLLQQLQQQQHSQHPDVPSINNMPQHDAHPTSNTSTPKTNVPQSNNNGGAHILSNLIDFTNLQKVLMELFSNMEKISKDVAEYVFPLGPHIMPLICNDTPVSMYTTLLRTSTTSTLSVTTVPISH